MGSSVGFYCGSKDDEALRDFAKSIGLLLIAPTVDKAPAQDAADGPYCLLSLVPVSELHPYGQPPIRISDAKDPVMRFMRGYFKNPYLVAGHIYRSDDVPMLGAKTKGSFQKLTKWIKGEWEKLPGGDFYVGPEAKILIEKGAHMVNVLPEQASVSVIRI